MKSFRCFLYLAMGWLVVIDFKNIIASLEPNAIILLVISGLFYSFGIIFYRLEKIKYFPCHMAHVCFEREYKSLFSSFILYYSVVFKTVMSKNHDKIYISKPSIFII
jgi:channel protein (hemolysin III family)